MRYVMLGVVLVLATAAPARADSSLTDALAGAFLVRTVDAGLHDIAHQRVLELDACDCLEHEGMRPGTAEVVAFNSGVDDPVAHVVGQWRGSASHAAILSNTSYGSIGCAELVGGGVHWFACVLAPGPLPPQPAPAPPAITLLPDTALPPPDRD